MASDNELLIKLGVESSSASKQIKEITKELKTLDKQMDSVDKSVDGFNQSMSGIGKQAGLFQDKLDLLNTQLNLYKNKLEDASNQLDKARKKMEELGDRTKENGDEWDKANKKLEVAQTRYNNTVRNMKEVENQIESTNKEIRKLGEAVDDLNFDKFSGEIDQLNADLKTLDTVIDSFDTSTGNFGNSMQNAMNKMGAYGEKISVLNKSIDKHKEALKSTESTIKSVENYLDSLGERTEENATEWDRASDYIEKYKDKQNQLENSLREVQSELRTTTNEVQELNVELQKAPLEHLSDKLRTIGDGFRDLGDATQPLSVAMIGLGTIAGKTAMDFEDAMAKVQATSGVSAEELEVLEQKARQIGKTTQLSATEGAEALLLLAQAGYDTEQSLTMVDSVVNLAIANEMDLARATEIVTASMNAYGWELNRTQELTDILSAVSRASSTDVGEVGEAFRTVAPTANALGFEVADVSMVLGLMANNAIHGAEAGNGLKSILSSLVKPTENGAAALKKLGVEVADSKGNMKDLDEIVVDLQEAFAGLSEEEQAQIATTLVGKMQMSKFLAIVNSGGDDVDKLSEAIGNCTGLTEEMKNTMEDTAGGAWREFQSVMEETAIIVGDKLLPHFVKILEKIGDLAIKFGELDEDTQSLILGFGGFLAVLSPLSTGIGNVFNGLSSITGIMGKISGKVASATTNVDSLGGAFDSVGTVIGSTKAGSLLGGLNALGIALAPWLVGGAIAFGVGATVVGLVEGYKNLQKQVEESANDYDYGTDLMMDANERLAQDVAEKYEAIEEDMYNFRSNGIETLLNSFDGLEEGAEVSFDGFLTTCQTKMGDAKIAVQENSQEMSEALKFLNTDIATVFSESDLANIQDGWSRQMTKGMEVAYSNLETTINEKDGIIEGLMIDHGYSYEQAYSEWEGRVLEQYQDFCDELIKAQTGYQEDSLGSLDQFLADQEFKNRGDYNQYLEFLRENKGQQASIIAEEYAECKIAIQRGEKEINDIRFDSAEQTQKYADLTFQYRMKQLDLEQERKIQVATETAYQLGIIDEETYNKNMEASKKREQLYTDEFDALSLIMQECGEDVAGSWDEVWSAIMEAEETGISKSLTQNKDFVEALGVYFDSGGENMEEAIRFAFDAIIGKTDKSVEELDKQFGKMDTQTQAKFNNIMNKMTDTGATLEEVCEGSGVDVQTMIDYIHYLATQTDTDLNNVDTSIEDTKTSIEGLKNESVTDTGAVARDFGNMGTRVMSALTNMDGSLVNSSRTTTTETGKMVNATAGVSKNFGNMGTRVMSALVDTQGNLIKTAKVASTESSKMQRSINGVKGKTVDVTVNFKTINYASTISKMQQAKTHVYSAALGGYKDALIPALNFGENYMEDLYGLKDAGIKTISLAHLEDGISAYATKDTTASSIVNESVANYNYNTQPAIEREIRIPNSLIQQQQKNNNEKTIEINLNIENMNGNQQDIDKLIKMIDDRIRTKSKRW